MGATAKTRDLDHARDCLARAEAGYRSAGGLAKLVEGLEILDDLLDAADEQPAATARNLAGTYAGRIYGRIRALLDDDPALPEPELEHFFRVVLAFDQVADALPSDARALKIEVARRLIDRYYEGHPADKKQQALDALQRLEDG